MDYEWTHPSQRPDLILVLKTRHFISTSSIDSPSISKISYTIRSIGIIIIINNNYSIVIRSLPDALVFSAARLSTFATPRPENVLLLPYSILLNIDGHLTPSCVPALGTFGELAGQFQFGGKVWWGRLGVVFVFLALVLAPEEVKMEATRMIRTLGMVMLVIVI